jgi:hypothetical protein
MPLHSRSFPVPGILPKRFPILLAALLAAAPAARAGDLQRSADFRYSEDVQRANEALHEEDANGEAGKEQRVGSRFFLTGAGLLLVAGGSAFAYHHDREADRAMTRYRGSAFTENSEHLRDEVRDHDRLTWLGVAGAALGGILVVVSF